MMKVVAVMVCFLSISISLHAHEKWIVIEPLSLNEKSKSPEGNSRQNIGVSPFQPVEKLVENAKVIQHLLDNKKDNKEPEAGSEKNWYIIKNMDND